MLAVEREADKVVASSRQEAGEILEKGRQKANEILADAQVALVVEVEKLIKTKLEEARQSKSTRLEEADKKMGEQITAFQKEVLTHLDETVNKLLFPKGRQ